MVSGTKLPLGDPWLQRQNEPSIAVSSRNPMHLFAAANDYRTIDMPDDYSLPGIPGASAVRDSWIGVFESFNAGESSVTTLLPGFPQDTSAEGMASPIHGFDTACDPIVRAGARGLFYLSGIVFNRNQQQGAVFVARYVDFNNRENVEEEIDQVSGYKKYVGPIKYIDTKAVDRDTQRRFLDMPNMAVDVPRGGAPYGNIYVAYTVFLGDTTKITRSRIILVRSSDGGVTWTWPTILSEFQYLVQRPVIVIDPSDPTGKTIYVVFRRFAFLNKPDGIGFVKSIDGGKCFTFPADVATLPCPFDQLTTNTSFRTNSYPTMAVDGNGIVYVAWAQRYDKNGLPNPNGQARIVISYSKNRGLTWSAPRIVDQTSPLDGHQFMPTMTFGGGRLMLAWYDQRDDIFLHHPNTKFIEDGSDHRHTIDVRAAEGTPGTPPTFQASIPVSRYLYYMQMDANGEPIKDIGGNVVLWQGQYNFINFPLFNLGMKPFHGDYIEIASSPQILPPPATASNSWVFNTSPSEPTTSPLVWTDNRDVRPPAGNLWGDWIHYNPPTSTQDGDFGQNNTCNNKDNTGMKNQNIYVANLNHGVIVGSPGNTKQLDIQRAFVVVVKNTMEPTAALGSQGKHLYLTLNPASGVPASFDEFDSNKASLDVTVEPSSSVSCTVYAGPSTGNPFAPVRVNVYDGENGPLVGYVILNPDSTNNPILDPSGEILANESHSPKISNPKVWRYDVGNPTDPNTSFLSPRVQNPRVQNSGYVNPRVQNEGITNPRVQNPRVQNPGVQNENIVNNEMLNPRVQNPRVQNTALTDMTWTVTNDGNTTSAYTFDLLSTVAQYFSGTNPSLIGQVLVYKIHTNPIDNECQLLETHSDELVVNVSNPRVQNPRVQNTPLQTMSAADGNSGTQNIAFNLSPGERAEVILRVYDPDITDPIAFDTTTVAGETTAEAGDTGATAPPEPVLQPNVPWESPLPVIVASPISMSFAGPGNQTLNLSLSNLPGEGSLPYSVSVDSSWLSVSQTGGDLSGAPTTLNVTVSDTGLAPGTHTGFIVVTVPAASNNPLRIPVYWTNGTIFPSMAVSANGSSIGDGGTCAFGSIGPGTTADVTFSISNDGSANLILGGKPIITITGANADQFSVQQQPTSPVANRNSTSFKIRFQPTSSGPKTATISITNNTLGTNPYDIALQGTGAAPIGGLIAYYPFNGNANDESGNRHNGIIHGSPSYSQDRFGNANGAMHFNGVDTYVELPDEPSFDLTQMTIVATVKVPDYSKENFIISKGPYFGNYTLRIFSSSNPSFQGQVEYVHQVQNGNWDSSVTQNPVPLNQFFQIAVTLDSTSFNSYFNGIKQAGPILYDPMVLNDVNVTVGAEMYNTVREFFVGDIDEIRIYNRALSASEVQTLYSLDLGQVAYYPFNGNANDVSGHGFNGTVYVATLTADRFGNQAGAYSFNGDNAYIDVGNVGSFNFGAGDFTLEAWIQMDPFSSGPRHILGKRDEAYPYLGSWTRLYSLDGQIRFEFNDGWALYTQKTYNDGIWHHIAATRSNGAVSLYIDGQLIGSDTRTVDVSNSASFKIGKWSFENSFHGKIDDIRIYNRALSATEVAEHFLI
jgi:hypothetical protein